LPRVRGAHIVLHAGSSGLRAEGQPSSGQTRARMSPHMPTTTGTFALGRIVATANAIDSIPMLDILAALDRHASGDWGDLPGPDRASNEEALLSGERLISAYSTAGGTRFWIITERDRSVTTVLLPEDY
jgi:hypothetical protein